ncbi:MAG: PIG-L family deacetylase [Gemmatimonadetes bacterium]|nr:PIG-L family deacetylase [Gemmatimonadota bacterium]
MHPDFLRLGDEDAWARGVLIVAAHPDDETIGAGGVMPHLPIAAVVHMTDGAPADRRWWGDPSLASREVYAGVRRAELGCALALAGLGADRVRSLGREDQRASLDMAALVEDLAWLIHELRPGVILTHPYEGGHPDHDATAFAVHAAREMVEDPPIIVEFTAYHASSGGMATGDFLPCGDGEPSGRPSLAPAAEAAATTTGSLANCARLHAAGSGVGTREWRRSGIKGEAPPPSASLRSGETIDIALTAEDWERKAAMLACFATQAETLAQFPVQTCERFRIAPAYDFTRAPHDGTLHYERFDWGVTGAEWRRLAAEAARSLDRRTAISRSTPPGTGGVASVSEPGRAWGRGREPELVAHAEAMPAVGAAR